MIGCRRKTRAAVEWAPHVAAVEQWIVIHSSMRLSDVRTVRGATRTPLATKRNEDSDCDAGDEDLVGDESEVNQGEPGITEPKCKQVPF